MRPVVLVWSKKCVEIKIVLQIESTFSFVPPPKFCSIQK